VFVLSAAMADLPTSFNNDIQQTHKGILSYKRSTTVVGTIIANECDLDELASDLLRDMDLHYHLL
jgi:hypothetical protein